MAVALSRGPSRYAVRGSRQELGRNGVVVVDFRTPYSFSHAGARGSSFTTRTLYTVWGDRDGGLADWIIRRRLDRVRRDLATAAPGVTISAVARRWGFADPAHFSRRFRAAYGTPPSDWVRTLHNP